MPHFTSYDGTALAYHEAGVGDPLVCLPGGPGRASAYLGDLGGLATHRRLVLLDHRGTGASAVPEDPATYRCDRLVEDVDALRAELGLDRMDLLAHSAAGNLAVLYAARYPDRLRRLVLVTPGLAAAGIEETDEEWREAVERFSGEPWYATAHAALMAWDAGDDRQENRDAAAPFFYGRWDGVTAAHAAPGFEDRSPAFAAGYYAAGAFDPPRTRALLAGARVPVLVVAGGRDMAPTPRRAGELAALFPDGRIVLDPDAAHYPWITDPGRFVAAVAGFLAGAADRP